MQSMAAAHGHVEGVYARGNRRDEMNPMINPTTAAAAAAAASNEAAAAAVIRGNSSGDTHNLNCAGAGGDLVGTKRGIEYTTPAACSSSSSSNNNNESRLGQQLDGLELLQEHLPSPVVDAFFDALLGTDDIPHMELIEALRTAPHLVLEESCPKRYFVQVCGTETSTEPSVAREVAMKLGNYWKARKELYGERFCLPMIMPCIVNGKVQAVGVLTEQDMEVLNTGFMAILPPSADPVKGRSVVAVDRSRLPVHYMNDHRARFRVGFYLLNAMAYNPVSQKEGIVFVALPLTNTSPVHVNIWGLRATVESFPFKKFEFHGLFLPSRKMPFGSLLPFGLSDQIANSPFTAIAAFASMVFRVASVIYNMYSQYKAGACANIHIGMNDEQVLQNLVDQSRLNRADIPVWISPNSTYTEESFRKWKKRQQKIERKQYLAEVDRLIQRNRNAKRSQRKRVRDMAKVKELKTQIQDLQQENQSVRDDNTRLESLLHYAKEETNVIEGLALFEGVVFCGGGDGLQLDQVFDDADDEGYRHRQHQHHDQYLVDSDSDDERNSLGHLMPEDGLHGIEEFILTELGPKKKRIC